MHLRKIQPFLESLWAASNTELPSLYARWKEQCDEPDLLSLVEILYKRELSWRRTLAEQEGLIHIDEVTGLFNSRYLDLVLDREISRFKRSLQTFSLLFLDLDKFKDINDKFGHLSGSSVLRQVGEVLRSSLRETDALVRYGGDEFILVLEGANIEAARLTAERVRKKIGSTLFSVGSEGEGTHLTASIGIANFPKHAATKLELIEKADAMMYRAKLLGRNRSADPEEHLLPPPSRFDPSSSFA